MENDPESSVPLKCSEANSTDPDCNDLDSNVVAQFELIIIIVLILLLAFLGFFVYNLIKCYLPKWTGKKRCQEEGIPAKIQSSVDASSTNREGSAIEL